MLFFFLAKLINLSLLKIKTQTNKQNPKNTLLTRQIQVTNLNTHTNTVTQLIGTMKLEMMMKKKKMFTRKESFNHNLDN